MENLTCNGISKKYGNNLVLDNIDLTLEKGKIYGLIGRNGAGKTTLLSILSAQNTSTSGSVTVDGDEVWENQKALDKICFSRELNPVSANGTAGLKIKEYLSIAATYLPYWDKDMADRLVKEFELNPKTRI